MQNFLGNKRSKNYIEPDDLSLTIKKYMVQYEHQAPGQVSGKSHRGVGRAYVSEIRI